MTTLVKSFPLPALSVFLCFSVPCATIIVCHVLLLPSSLWSFVKCYRNQTGCISSPLKKQTRNKTQETENNNRTFSVILYRVNNALCVFFLPPIPTFPILPFSGKHSQCLACITIWVIKEIFLLHVYILVLAYRPFFLSPLTWWGCCGLCP